MTVEKIIRIFEYAAYVALWSPLLVIGLIVLPFVYMYMFRSVTDGLTVFKQGLKSGLRHDMEFIKTGVWL